MTLRNKVTSLSCYWVPVAIAAILKVWLLSTDSIPFNADEAIVALMARHINQGKLPVFFYGQAYMGSMDAILVALGFRIFGEHIWVIRAIQSLLYLGTVYTTALLGFRLLGSRKAAIFSGLLVAIPPVNITLYSTISLGGYGEMLLVGNLLLLGGLEIYRKIKTERLKPYRGLFALLLIWGICAGVGFWVIGLSLVYTIPVILMLFWALRSTENTRIYIPAVALLIIGGIIGSLPWWIFAIGDGNVLVISELSGSAIAGLRNNSGLLQPLVRLGNLLLLGSTVILGLRPPWTVRWLMLPLLPFLLVFWFAVLFNSFNTKASQKEQTELWMIRLIGIVLLIGFILSPYGADPSGRYFVPLIIPMAIFGAYLLTSQIQGKTYFPLGVLLLVLFFNLGGTVQSVRSNPPGVTTQFDAVTQIDQRDMGDLIAFLELEEVTRGYSNYWVSYPLVFLSQEQLVFVPRLPYHEDFRYTARDDRYPPYNELVQIAEEVGFITTNHPELDNYLRTQFEIRGVTWQEKKIGDFQVFYDFSTIIRPQELGLGSTTTP